jgi:colanic acid biosynthesis glycosyl transferase WcaI
VSSFPRRVIFVNRVYWPSTEATAQLLTDLAESLAARGWDVHVIAAGHDTTPRRHGVTIHRTGAGERHGGLVSRALNFRRFQAAARDQLAAVSRRGDVVVAMTDPPLLASHLAPVARRLSLPLVCWIQDIYPEIAAVHFGPVAGWFASPLRRQRDAAWRDAAACVTLGDDMRQTVLAQGVAPERVQLIANWAPRELQRSPPPADVAARRAAWGASDQFVVGYSGNLGRVHEFSTVLEAATLLKDVPKVLFALVGRGPRFEEVAREARARGLRHVHLLPPEPRERLPAALAAADAHLVTLQPAYAPLVYPSKLAGVLAAARPVLHVGPPDGDIARLLRREACGATFAPGEARALADTIVRWQAQPAQVADLGARARSVYERDFQADTAITRWEKLLLRIGTGA